MQDSILDRLREYCDANQGRVVNLRDIRLSFDVTGPNDDALLRKHLSGTLVKEKIVSPSGRKAGEYKVIRQVQQVKVFVNGRVRRSVFDLKWPQDRERGVQMDFADHVVTREGDLIVFGGVKSRGKTTLCLNMSSENIDSNPVLMGNEYTVFVDGHYEPSQRFFNRLTVMSDHVKWTDEDGHDKFTLLPVSEDYAEHIVRDRINIIDWINLDANQLYDIGKVLEGIKKNLGRGVAIVALQKSESAESKNARGGQFVRDFADVEILLDGFGDTDDDVLLTVKGCKEKTAPIVGKTYAYTLANQGTEIINFREVRKCTACKGSGWAKTGTCEECLGAKYVDK